MKKASNIRTPKPPKGHRDPIFVCGLPICRESRRDVKKHLTEALHLPAARPFLLFTPNIEILLSARSDAGRRETLKKADLLLPDGIGVVLLSRFRIAQRIPGIEIGEFLLGHAARKGFGVFLLGGARGIAEQAARRLTARFPGIRIVGTHSGYFPTCGAEERAICEQIRRSGAALLIVCMGFPRQEEFLVRNRTVLSPVRMAAGLGGSLDVWAGAVRRAPLPFRVVGLEWLYRMLREPWRFRRFLSVLAHGL